MNLCLQVPALCFPEGVSWCGVEIHTEGNYYFPGTFVMIRFLFIGKQKVAVQETEDNRSCGHLLKY